jgi:hypothetical protein
MLPKIQQYKDYYFPPRRTNEDIQAYRSFFHKTDNVTIRMPKITKIDDAASYLNLKRKYGSHSETYQTGWVPQGNFKTMNNRSSVNYNILSNDNNPTSGALVLKILDKKITNKKKGVAEIVDLTRPFNPNVSKKYVQTVNDNNSVFHRYNGIFSHMYDAAHRNGNIVVPFRNNSSLNDESGHKSSARHFSPKHSAKKRSKSPKRD